MIKLKLLSACICFTIVGFSQNTYYKVEKLNKTTDCKKIDNQSVISKNKGSILLNKNKGTDDFINIGSSGNAYSVVVPSSSVLTYNKDLNILMFTHRRSVSYNSFNDGAIQCTYSLDRGLTWDSSLIVYNNNTYFGRYPSGVIVNKQGNTDPLKAYAVVCGPSSDANEWKGNYFASSMLDSTNLFQQVELYADTPTVTYQQFVRNYMIATNDGKIRVFGDRNKDNGSEYSFIEFSLNTGTLDTVNNKINWEQKIFESPFVDNIEGYGRAAVTFSDDGSIGYVVMNGRDKDYDILTYQPIVYKTLDSGATWNKMPNFDFNTISSINQRLRPTRQGTKRAIFSDIKDTQVDAYGNLHVAFTLWSASSNNTDSLLYYYSSNDYDCFAYDVFTKNDNTWDAVIIDTIFAKEVKESNDPLRIGYDNRLQMAKSEDGKKMLFAWMDTDMYFWGTDINSNPDIFIRGYDIDKNFVTKRINVSKGTDFEATCFYMYLSDKGYVNDDTTKFYLPITVSIPGETDESPMFHYFIKDVYIDYWDFNVGIENNNINNESKNVKIYPNPIVNEFNIEFNYNRNEIAQLSIYNVYGQEIININNINIKNGNNIIPVKINENVKNGVYFCKIISDNNEIISSSRIVVFK